ncbi:MAG: DNA gyrase inhibitor YacG [Maricaulaceae bacterium]|jgi:endogenous inhibitor of DNA gyrase (YacG/DUF329 family)
MPCPICKKPTAPEFKPFCSKRCADVDLGRWMKGAYVVPGRDGDAAESLGGAVEPKDEEE